MIYQRWLLLLAALAIVLYGSLFVLLRHADARTLVCEPPRVDNFIVWIADRDGVPLDKSDELFNALKSLNGPSMWVRTPDYGYFNWSSDHQTVVKLWLLPSRNMIWFGVDLIKHEPYVLWFWDYPEFARADGKYWGIHPCKAFWITYAQADAIYAILEKLGSRANEPH